MDRAHILIHAEGPGDGKTDSAAGVGAPSHRETLFGELTGHGFIASLSCAGVAAILALSRAFDGLIAYDRTASIALLTTVVVACFHVKRSMPVLPEAAPESDWVIWRHRALLLAFGLCCAVASQAWAQTNMAASTASVSVLMLIGGLGVSSAAVDRTSLLLWIGAVLALPTTTPA